MHPLKIRPPALGLALMLTFAVATPARAIDDFTLYELLAPDTNQFAITYDTTAMAGGVGGYYFNGIRTGSEATDERVVNRGTGAELAFEVVDGIEARASGMSSRVPDDAHFIRVPLPDVASGAEVRLRIFKTYRDPESYYADGDRIVFERSLGIKANAVVLPAGYELIEASVPVIVTTQPDGRVKVSMLNDRNDALEVRLVGRALAASMAGEAR